ncbi:MAG: Holliday junction branch migration protein RuvA [Marinilabiliales bacterium]|nr:MAG: Holliday junction branch migration protein RuvA [Marinilabiliales bacterium]
MYEYITGTFHELAPAHLVVDSAGTGFFVNISLNTFSALSGKESGKIFLHQVVREDALLLFGFADKDERELFRQLITVSGIGANTARVMLSSLSPADIRKAIASGNVEALKGVKGIGVKSAQRIIVDLRDKLSKTDGGTEIFAGADNTIREESLSALIMLGFSRNAVEKVISQLLNDGEVKTAEDLVKRALKKL